MTTGKTIALTRWTFVDKVMSLLFNMPSRWVITFLPRSKHLLISWLQSPSALILEPPKIKSATVSPSIAMKRWELFLLYWLRQSLWLWGSQETVGNSERDGIPDHLTCFLRNLYAGQEATVRTWKQRTGSKLGKAIYCHLVYLTYMQSTSWEMPGWMKHKFESRFLGEISITSDRQMTPLLWQKVKRN